MQLRALSMLLFMPLLFGQDNPAKDARGYSGCGPINIKFSVKTLDQKGTLTQPQSGKAVAYIFQDEKLDPSFGNIFRTTTRVGLDGQWLGANHGDSYFFFSVEPGEHHLCTDWQSRLETFSKLGSAVTFIAEAGKSYYFRAELFPGREQRPPTLKLEAVDTADGQFQISSRNLAISKPKKAATN